MEARPDPDALLRQAQKDPDGRRKGRLKIFLGAAPGVGKTFEMLTTAQHLMQEGADVVVGVVETHGRAETARLTEGLEALPPRPVAYRGRTLHEMDLDAVLARRPNLVLVDELAHTNAPGSRHPKRWMDVEEILSAGIDVMTTVNIQHLESLNDIVAGITRVRVRETVPDSVLDEADEIELVDLTPGDLLARMRDGKIYAAPGARRAMLHYFTPGNLTALRELALRQTAQQVNAQLVDHMKANAIAGPWAAGERILVCLTFQDRDEGLIRYAKRLADRLHAPWIALHIETSRDLSDTMRAQVAAEMHLAKALGAETAIVPGGDVALDALAYARANNVTQIVAGHPLGSGWQGWLRARLGLSVTDRLVRHAGSFPIHIVARSADAGREPLLPAPRPARKARVYLESTLIVTVAVGVSFCLRQGMEINNVSLAFLTAILWVAVAYGLWPSLWASVLGMLSFNFFFLPPLYTFTIAAPENVVAMFFFFLTAVIASHLGARVRSQAVVARHRADITQSLYQFSRELAGILIMDDLLWTVCRRIAALLGTGTVLLMPEGEGMVVRASSAATDGIGSEDLAAAAWAWRHDRVTGRDSDTLPGAQWLFVPARTGRGPVAVIGLDSEREGPILDPEQRQLLDALSDQTALAIERIAFAEDLDRARLGAETEKLRGALLTSISHDLRTPLAAILGAASSLDGYDALLGPDDRKALTETIREEAERLNRFVANLLDMTRLEAGGLSPRRERVDLAEVAGSALSRAAQILAHHDVVLDAGADLPMLLLDDVLLEQALFNLLDNAAKYTAPGTRVTVRLRHEADHVVLSVLDEGEGLGVGDPDRVFDKFARFRAADRSRPGTGLGLAIARGFVEAMGGRIVARDRRDRAGAAFIMIFPVEPPPGVPVLPSTPVP